MTTDLVVRDADGAPRARTLRDADALRAHLDLLNYSGVDSNCSGMDALGQPFLVSLNGPYAETEHVFTTSPWDAEASFSAPARCEECAAHSPLRLTDLAYPVLVLLPVGDVCGLPEGHDSAQTPHQVSGGYRAPLCGVPIFD